MITIVGSHDDNRSSDHGTPGASARREYERRKANRQQRARQKHRYLGDVLLALQDEPQHQRAWDRGARGEARVAESLARHLKGRAQLLHDRRIPGSRANIDHIAIASSGVWVIDAKRYKGRVASERPLFGAAKLTIAGRDKTSLTEGLARQVEVVQAAVADLTPSAPVHGALCFVDADLPTLRTLTFNGYVLLYPRALAKRIAADGSLGPEIVTTLATALATRLPAA